MVVTLVNTVDSAPTSWVACHLVNVKNCLWHQHTSISWIKNVNFSDHWEVCRIIHFNCRQTNQLHVSGVWVFTDEWVKNTPKSVFTRLDSGWNIRRAMCHSLGPVWSCLCCVSAEEKQLSLFIFCLHRRLPVGARSAALKAGEESEGRKLANTPKLVIVKLQQIESLWTGPNKLRNQQSLPRPGLSKFQ